MANANVTQMLVFHPKNSHHPNERNLKTSKCGTFVYIKVMQFCYLALENPLQCLDIIYWQICDDSTTRETPLSCSWLGISFLLLLLSGWNKHNTIPFPHVPTCQRRNLPKLYVLLSVSLDLSSISHYLPL